MLGDYLIPEVVVVTLEFFNPTAQLFLLFHCLSMFRSPFHYGVSARAGHTAKTAGRGGLLIDHEDTPAVFASMFAHFFL